MGKTYDTAEIRRYARKLEYTADQVRGTLMAKVQTASSEADKASSSEAEKAIQARLTTVRQDMKRSYNHLMKTAQSMYQYANKLDEADRAAQSLIKSK